MTSFLRTTFLAAAAVLMASAANATIATVFDTTVSNGVTSFNTTVTNAGGTATADNWSSLPSGSTSIDRGDYTITRNNGGAIYPTTYTPPLSGDVIDIDPCCGSPGAGSIDSGITMTFNTAINAIGFEVGDWGTCCQPSALYISFDDGTPIQVGISTTYGDVASPDGSFRVFVAAFDDTGDFNKIQFWGDGYGEILVAGGTVRYALLDQGSLPPSGVPEPMTLALFGAGLAGVGAMRRKKKA